MADQEISYEDAFAQPKAPPSVPMAGGGTPEVSYDEALGKPKDNAFDSIDKTIGLYAAKQAVFNAANAFGDSVRQSGEDIDKNLHQQDGGELIESLKQSGMFSHYVQDQNDFNQSYLYKNAIPAIHDMLSGFAENVTRGLAATVNIVMTPLNAVGSAIGGAAEGLPEGPVKELAQYEINRGDILQPEMLPEFHAMPRVPRTVAESEASGIIGTTEDQNSGIVPLTEDQHIRQSVAESEVNPIQAKSEEPVVPVEQENNIHGYARALEPDTFQQYDKLASERDSLRDQLSRIEPNTQEYYDTRQKIQETNSQLRDLAPKVSDAYLQAQQFEEQPESVLAGDEESGSTKFTTSKGSTYKVQNDRTTIRNKSFHPEHGKEDVGIQPRSESTFYIDPKDAKKLGEIQTINDKSRVIEKLQDGRYGIKYLEGKDSGKFESRTVVKTQDVPREGLIPVELFDNGKRVHFGNEITKVEKQSSRVGSVSVEPLEEQKAELVEKISPITHDIERKLIAVGRSADEARASAEVAARMYQYFSDVYGGEKGTAQDWYAREGADIKGAKERATVLAQPGKGGIELNQVNTEKTNTPEFKNWFGDSKVVDKNGSPKLVFHGTPDPFEAFSLSKSGSVTGADDAKEGFFFTDRKRTAKNYMRGKNPNIETARMKGNPTLFSTYLSLKNPYIADMEGKVYREQKYIDIINKAKEEGHDGVIIKNTYDGGEYNRFHALLNGRLKGENIYVAFKPEQIKSSENFGDFDPNDPRLLYQSSQGKIRLATDDANAVISLMKSADASTFVHESSHHFLDMMDRFSKEDDAPEKLKSDMAIIRKWTGLSDKEPITAKDKRNYRQAQEKFARGFERYLMEGVAPNRDMALVFAKFKKWMTSIYKTVLNIPDQRGAINEDIRDFFDRVLSRTPEKTIIADNHPAELGLKENINNPKLKDLFGAVPKAPETLTEWLAGKGGIKDNGTGDLASLDADKAHIDLKTGKPKPFVNKLVKEDGMSLDDAARAAQEAGYFPEKGTERPSIEEIKSKIREDLSGNKQYSDKDQEALNNHNDALKYNAETDRISHETGIDPTGKSHDQFWDEVDKHYQDEKHYNEAQDIASEARDDFEDYERKEREFIESRGEAWEAPKEPDYATLEDLENERKQEQIANDATSNAKNNQESAGTPGTGEPSETGIRQVGGGAESDGRTGPSQIEAAELAARQHLEAARTNIADAPVGDTKQPEPKSTGSQSANEPIRNDKTGFFDKAGNVRLDLLTDNESVKSAMREAAEKNPQIFNHGVITDAQVAEFADSMGIDAKNINIQKLRDISVNDDIPLAARIRSGSQMMVEALNHSLELMNKENPTDDDAVKFLEAKNQFMMIAETVSATTNEMGRGFRAYNNLMKEYNVTDIHEITELFQRMTGRTLDDIKGEMKAGSALKTPKQIAKYTRDSFKPDFMDKLIEYRNNSLLSGPVTHTFYTAGGFVNAAYKPIQKLAGLAIQSIRELAGSEIEERMYAQEALAQMHAIGYGSMRGLIAAGESWKRNAEVALPKEISSAPLLAKEEQGGLEKVKGSTGMGWLPRSQSIQGTFGKVINTPSRVIGMIHSFQKVLNYQQNLAALSVREAMDKGFKPGSDEYTKYISDTIDNPSAKMMDAAGSGALKEVYREKVPYNSTSGKLFNIVNSSPVTKVLFPFIKMQYNIKRIAFRDNSVLGLFSKELRPDLAGLNGDAAKNMAIGKIAAGTALAGVGISLTMQGLNNGGGPSDPKAYKTWRLTHTPYSVQIGSLVIPHKALGIPGQLFGMAANLAEGAHEFNSDDIEKSSWEFIRKAGDIFTEEGFLTQAKDTLNAAFTPGQFGARFLQNFATQWLPFSVGASQTNRLLNDPYSRRVKSLGMENLYGVPEAMEYKYPGTSELLQPSRDMFGRPMTFSSSYDQYANDPVVQKLESLQTGIGRLPDKIRGVQLTEQQYDDYSRIAGQMTYARLSKIVAMPGFDNMPPQHQMALIEKTVTQCRQLASTSVMKVNPNIMRQAIAKKKLAIYGNRAVNDEKQDQTEDTNNP